MTSDKNSKKRGQNKPAKTAQEKKLAKKDKKEKKESPGIFPS